MNKRIEPLWFLPLLAVFAAGLRGADELVLPPASMSIPAVIDQAVEAGWKERGIKPASPADDHTWLRRVTLDLTGRIPTVPEV
jgi:hypothetical protein